METSDQLLRCIDEASKCVPVDQFALSPRCGFASVLEGNLPPEDQQRRKLELVVETARKVWADASSGMKNSGRPLILLCSEKYSPGGD